MKRLEKKLAISQEELDQLNAFEQSAVLGGYGIDIDNNNRTSGCICEYNNHSIINNNNEVDGCLCNCV